MHNKTISLFLSFLVPILIFNFEIYLYGLLSVQNNLGIVNPVLSPILIIIPIAVGFKILDYAFKFKEHAMIIAIIYSLPMLIFLFLFAMLSSGNLI
jgi:hypothetical protein